MEIQQRENAKWTDRFIKIVNKDGFVIDKETAAEFKTFCESSDNQDQQ